VEVAVPLILWENRLNHTHVFIEVIDAEPAGSELVPARQLGDDSWEISRSPLYATEVAAGDIIKVIDAEKGTFEIIRRGRNIGVQFYLGEDEATTAGLISLTIPVCSGFPAIEDVLEFTVGKNPGTQWQYTNVFDPITGESLGWWK